MLNEKERLSLKDKAIVLKSAVEKISDSFDQDEVEDVLGEINQIEENIFELGLSEDIFNYDMAIVDVISTMIVESKLTSKELLEMYYVVKDREDSFK